MFEEKKVYQLACGTQHVVALAMDEANSEVPAVDHSTFVKVQSKVPPKEPKVVKEGEEEAEEEDGPEIPEFNKSSGYKQLISGGRAERTTKNGDKAPEVKESEATTAHQESVIQQKQNIGGGKVVSSTAMQMDAQAEPLQMELKETTENLSQMLSQGKKRTLDEHEEGLQEAGQPDQNDPENGNV